MLKNLNGDAWDRSCPRAVTDSEGMMTRLEWINCVKCGSIIDYDGFGQIVKDGMEAECYIRPSQIDDLPLDCTHIMWFNR